MAFDWIGEWFVKGFDYYKESEQELEAMFPPTRVTVDLAVSKIKGLRGPFFAFLHLWDTHFPFPNTPFEGSGKDDSRAILDGLRDEKLKAYVKNRLEAVKLYTVDDVVAKYDETLKIVDHEVGRLYDFLEAEGLIDNTVFIVLGDHGDVIDSHGIHFANCGMFDEAIRAPLIMKFPGLAAREVGQMVQVTDIVPTIIDFLGESVSLDGKSLLPAINEGKKVRDEVFLVDAFANDVRAIRTTDRKLILAEDGYCNICKSNHHIGVEEYDLNSDPAEERNVFKGESEMLEHIKGLEDGRV
jgi:membrane-anchored protein YejM (alkaline phosphatase superfamily)